MGHRHHARATLLLLLAATSTAACPREAPPPSADLAAAPAVDAAAAPPAPSTRALTCDGVDDGARIDVRGLIDDPPALTIELWFRADAILPPAAGSPPEQILFATSSRNTTGEALRIAFENGYMFATRSVGATVGTTRAAPDAGCHQAAGTIWPTTLDPGGWHHVAATFERLPDGRVDRHLFLDGQPKPGDGPLNAGDQLCLTPEELLLCHGLAFDGPLSKPLRGAVDDVRVSRVVRYDGPFQPGDVGGDADTLLLVRFERLPLVDEGPHARAVTAEGAPALTDQVRR